MFIRSVWGNRGAFAYGREGGLPCITAALQLLLWILHRLEACVPLVLRNFIPRASTPVCVVGEGYHHPSSVCVLFRRLGLLNH